MEKLFDKILIANRGEIACRVARTARILGIKTVAIHSDADDKSLHVRECDEAYNVGPAPSAESYLNVDRIMEVIHATGAQAVHPGYGFLSENRDFATRLADEGITFIGPSAHAIEKMGDKIESMRIAEDAGVSCAPRFNGEVDTVEHALSIAEDIGYPIIMKASAGGGGKGMRVAWNPDELVEGFRLARDEAAASFGDNRMMIQHFVCPVDGRHVEIQLVGDSHGNVLCLPERECSIQRRNQKVIEEAPSVLLSEETRAKMQEQAAMLARAVGYTSAGTVEFLADNDENFYFLEMNTRLQVEHPVTELITGVDLVEQMIRVAAGHELPKELLEKDWSKLSTMNGWAIESRIYAEDPLRGFLPSIGRLTHYEEPHGDGVRVDSGIVEGSEISMHYDPMISKLCTHGTDRKDAIDRMKSALDSYVIRGLNHNTEFLQDVYNHQRFIDGSITTNFISDEYPEGFNGIALTNEESIELAVAAALRHASVESKGEDDLRYVCTLKGDEKFTVELNVSEDGDQVSADVETMDGSGRKETVLIAGVDKDRSKMYLTLASADNEDAATRTIQIHPSTDAGQVLQLAGAVSEVVVQTPREHELSLHMIAKPEVDMSKFLVSPMPGSLISVNVNEGDTVQPGQEICVVEAMKMQNVLRAEKASTVKKVLANPGATLQVDEVIVEYE
eukprot:g4041.t1